jgi:hypothetical protein
MDFSIINNKITMKQYIGYVFSALLLFFTPILGLLISIGVVIALDTLTGVVKTVKKKGWKEFSSKKLGDVIGKMLLYQLCVLLLFPLDYYLLNEFITTWFSIQYMFTKVCAIVLIFVELVSIRENLEEAFGINFWDMIKKQLQRGKEIKKDLDEIV